MRNTWLKRFLNSCSDNRKSKARPDDVEVQIVAGGPVLRDPAGTLLDSSTLPGDFCRKATGASEGDRSQDLPRGRPRRCDSDRAARKR